MATIEIKGKLIDKHNTAAAWEVSDYVPAAGERVIYDPDGTIPYPRIKVGNGVNKVNILPFVIDPTIPEWARDEDPPIGTGIHIGSSEDWPEGYEVCIDPNGEAYHYELTEDEMETIIDEVNSSMGNDIVLLKSQVASLTGEVSRLSSKKLVQPAANLNDVKEPDTIYLIPLTGEDGQQFYEEYINVDGFPEMLGNANVSFTNYPTFDNLKEDSVLYRHNITLRFRDVKGVGEGSNGAFMATFSIINNDPNHYEFDHNPSKVEIMSPQNAWQLLRLYRALSTTTTIVLPAGEGMEPGLIPISMNTARRPCSGSIIKPKDTYRGVINTVWAGYFHYDSSSSSINNVCRCITVTATRTDSGGAEEGGLDDFQKAIYCGKALALKNTAKGNYEENPVYIIDNYNEFYTTEYLGQIDGDQGSTWFCQHTLYCKDIVEKLNPYI